MKTFNEVVALAQKCEMAANKKCKVAAYYKMHNGEVKEAKVENMVPCKATKAQFEAKVKEKITTHKRYGEKNITVGIYVAKLWAKEPSVKYPNYECEISFGAYAFHGMNSTCAKKAVQNAVNILQRHKGVKEEEWEIKG